MFYNSGKCEAAMKMDKIMEKKCVSLSLLMRFRHVDSSEQLQTLMFVYILKNHGSLVPVVVLVTFFMYILVLEYNKGGKTV